MTIPKRGCPHCGHDNSMHATLAPGAGGPKIRWSCLHCGHTFDTRDSYWALQAVLGHQA